MDIGRRDISQRQAVGRDPFRLLFFIASPAGGLSYVYKKRPTGVILRAFSLVVWSHLGLNQGPPDYESDALTN